MLPRSSHGLQLENPAGFNEIVLGFLARHSRPPAPLKGPPGALSELVVNKAGKDRARDYLFPRQVRAQ